MATTTAEIFDIMTGHALHKPVMVERTLEFLRPVSGDYLDATVGYGGHAEALLEAGGDGARLIGIDRDTEALEFTAGRLTRFGARVQLVKENFSNLAATLDGLGIREIDGVLFDFGMSSPQVDKSDRGFGWTHPGPLDMRMDRDQETTAATLVNKLSEADLNEILRIFGEERFSKPISRNIVHIRRKSPIETTAELAAIVASSIPSRYWPTKRHPATRTFQALRIAVNNELDAIPSALESAAKRLRPGGRIVALSYHSLEDRLDKQTFRRLATGKDDGGRFPLTGTESPQVLDILAKRPLKPNEPEIRENPRCRSALLRAAERREDN